MLIKPRVLAVLAACMILAGCSGNLAFNKGDKYAVEGDWDKAVMEYRKALQVDPENITFKTRLLKATDQAAMAHIERAAYYIKQKNGAAALYEAQRASALEPTNDRARQQVGEAMNLKEAEAHVASGQGYLAAGRPNEALAEFQAALDIDPDNVQAKESVELITKRSAAEEEEGELELGSDQPITLSFKDAKLKEVFEFLSKLSGVSILFDEDVKDSPVTVFARDVSFKQALNLLLATNKLFMKKIAKDAIIIIPKTKSKQDQYQDLQMRTFYLNAIPAKDMVNIIRTMLETRKVIVNDTLNSITIRDTPDKLKLVEKLIESNDKRDAEVSIDVEVLQVEKSDKSTWGINLPKGASATYVPPAGVTPAPPPALGATGFPTEVSSWRSFRQGFGDVEGNLFFAYPQVSADWSQTKSNAEVLTNPQIRTLNNKPAKILIGSRIPVQTGTVTSTVGGAVTNSFEYRDVGIKLTVEPDIGLTNDITMKVTLEVSSVGTVDKATGQNTFNTTTAEATLSVKDGETVILGGLLENLKTSSQSGVIGLMDVPILGKIFSSNNLDPNSKREVILTLTPHVVRALMMPPANIATFWSGTEEGYDTKPLFEEKKESLSVKKPEVAQIPVAPPPGATPAPAVAPAPAGPAGAPPTAVTPAPAGTPPTAVTPAPAGTPPTAVMPAPAVAPAPQGPPPQPTSGSSGRVGTVSFAPEILPVDVGQEVTIDVMVSDMDSLFEAPLSIIYNPKLTEFVNATEGNFLKSDGKPTSFMATANPKVGYIDVFVTRLGKVPGISNSGKLFSLTFKGKAPGISPLVFKQNTLKDQSKQPVNADLKTGTLYVK